VTIKVRTPAQPPPAPTTRTRRGRLELGFRRYWRSLLDILDNKNPRTQKTDLTSGRLKSSLGDGAAGAKPPWGTGSGFRALRKRSTAAHLGCFCGCLGDVYLEKCCGALGNFLGALRHFLWCTWLLFLSILGYFFFSILGYFFLHRKTSLNGLRKHEWAAILRPKKCCIAVFLGATSGIF